ncbi:MAG TPA: helix-turn-helix domain-containing protein [Nocardioides sp.]|nr:helix-turn-helix domain-containing protein [Nocardioides sp.]
MTDDVAELRAFAASLLDTVTERGAEVAERVRERIPFYRDASSVSLADLETSCGENIRFVIDALAQGVPTDPAPAAGTGVRRAQADVPLPAVLAAYRIGFQVTWERFADEARAHGISADSILAATADAMVAHDVFTEAMARAYNSTVTARIVSQEAERSALVEALLGGAVLDRRTLWEVADLLGLPVSGRFVVASAVLAQPGRFALPGVETDLLGVGCRSAWRLLADVQVGVVDLGDTRLERVMEVLGSGTARVGLSPEFDEISAAARATELARLAGTAAPADGGVVRFEDQPVRVAAAAGGEVAQRVAAEVLGPLDALADAERYTLLETLQVWVEAGGSATKAGERLFCHANTVRYRLRRLEEKTGRRLDRPADVAALVLALETQSTQSWSERKSST